MAVVGCIAAGLLVLFGTLAFVHVALRVDEDHLEVRCGHIGVPRRRIPSPTSPAPISPRTSPPPLGRLGLPLAPREGHGGRRPPRRGRDPPPRGRPHVHRDGGRRGGSGPRHPRPPPAGKAGRQAVRRPAGSPPAAGAGFVGAGRRPSHWEASHATSKRAGAEAHAPRRRRTPRLLGSGGKSSGAVPRRGCPRLSRWHGGTELPARGTPGRVPAGGGCELGLAGSGGRVPAHLGRRRRWSRLSGWYGAACARDARSGRPGAGASSGSPDRADGSRRTSGAGAAGLGSRAGTELPARGTPGRGRPGAGASSGSPGRADGSRRTSGAGAAGLGSRAGTELPARGTPGRVGRGRVRARARRIGRTGPGAPRAPAPLVSALGLVRSCLRAGRPVGLRPGAGASSGSPGRADRSPHTPPP